MDLKTVTCSTVVTFPTKEAKFLRHRPYHLRCLITADVVEKLRQTGYQYVVSNSILRELKLHLIYLGRYKWSLKYMLFLWNFPEIHYEALPDICT